MFVPIKCTNIKYTTVSNAIIYSKFRFFSLVFAIYPVAYEVGFTLLGLPIVKWISNFKQQPIVAYNISMYPSPLGLGRRIVKLSPEIWVVHGEKPTQCLGYKIICWVTYPIPSSILYTVRFFFQKSKLLL